MFFAFCNLFSRVVGGVIASSMGTELSPQLKTEDQKKLRPAGQFHSDDLCHVVP